MSFDPEAVRAFEHAGWQRAAADYDATFAHASARFVEALLDAAGVTAGAKMLAEARRAHPQLRFDAGDAEAPPYPERSFDAVVSNFGIHHIPRPEQATAAALRMLRPGGRIAFTTWAAPPDNVAWGLVFDAIRTHGDPQAADAPPSGGNIGTPDAMSGLRQAGFAEVQVSLIHREWVVAAPQQIVAALLRGTVRMSALIAAQPAAARLAIEAAVIQAASRYRSASGFAVPIAAILAHGIRPAA